MWTVIILLVVAIIYFIYWCYRKEKKDFNGGVCKYCGGKLERREQLDSKGIDCYICPQCGYITYVSMFRRRTTRK